MEKKKIIGYRCNHQYDGQFTKGKIYQLNPGKNLNDSYAFIDDTGCENGWCYDNHKYFEPVYEEENYKLPPFWYIKGCQELSQYFKDNDINYSGYCNIYGYYLENGIWKTFNLYNGENIIFEEITLTEYLNSINNKMETKKIYYLKQEVKLNQEIDFNGLKITVTQDLINNNPNLFHVEEEKFDTALCVRDYLVFKKGETYKSKSNIVDKTIKIFDVIHLTTESISNTFFVKIDEVKYYKNSDGYIHKLYKTINSKGDAFHYDIYGNIGWCPDVCHKLFQVSTEQEYNKQQEIIKTIPEYVKHNESGMIFKTEYKPNETYPIKFTKPNHITHCSVNQNVIIKCYTPATKEEYDLQEELQELLDEAQKRYPVGTKLSKDLTVTLHPDKKTYLVYEDKKLMVHIGDGDYTYVKTKDVDWRKEYKEPVKDLKYYENFYIDNDYYLFMKRVHPNLYYRLILQTIANDLNGDWNADWMNGGSKYCINFYCGKINIDSHSYTNNPNVYFKTKELAQQALDILGEDKLKIIFNVK